MKKILIMLLVISFLSGCSQSNENSNKNTDILSQATATTKTDSITGPVATPENSISATFSPTPSPTQSSNETVFDKNNSDTLSKLLKFSLSIEKDISVRVISDSPISKYLKDFLSSIE